MNLPLPQAEAPRDAIAAATHADPYPYYAALREGPPLWHDARLGLWVASRAAVVEAVLADPACAVRPPQEPVPRAIAGTPSAEIFSKLVRMNDGVLHQRCKPVLQQALAQCDADTAVATALRLGQAQPALALSEASFALPLQAMAALLGFADDALPAVSQAVRRFVACLSPLASPAELDAASGAAQDLLAAFTTLLAAQPARRDSLLATVQAQFADGVLPREMRINLIGLLIQTCDATAGLLGNSLCALATQPAWAARVQAALARDASEHGEAASLLHAVVAETARWDAPVQNTRRFVRAPTVIAGTALPRGAAVLLLLAAANRDPALNAAPEQFDPARSQGRALGFGHGAHACPGQALAQALATGALLALLQRPGLLAGIRARGWHYRASVNARIPQFL